MAAYSTAMDGGTRSTEFVAPGHPGSDHYAGLESFANPGVSQVDLTSDELVAGDVRVTLRQKARGGITVTATS
jgi:hypothetical protein